MDMGTFDGSQTVNFCEHARLVPEHDGRTAGLLGRAFHHPCCNYYGMIIPSMYRGNPLHCRLE